MSQWNDACETETRGIRWGIPLQVHAVLAVGCVGADTEALGSWENVSSVLWDRAGVHAIPVQIPVGFRGNAGHLIFVVIANILAVARQLSQRVERAVSPVSMRDRQVLPGRVWPSVVPSRSVGRVRSHCVGLGAKPVLSWGR